MNVQKKTKEKWLTCSLETVWMVAARWPSSAYSLPSCFPLLLCPYALVFLQLQFRCFFLCVFLSFFIVFLPPVLWFFSSLSPCFLVFFGFCLRYASLIFFVSPPCRSWLFLLPSVLPFLFLFFVPFSIQKSPPSAFFLWLLIARESHAVTQIKKWLLLQE